MRAERRREGTSREEERGCEQRGGERVREQRGGQTHIKQLCKFIFLTLKIHEDGVVFGRGVGGKSTTTPRGHFSFFDVVP